MIYACNISGGNTYLFHLTYCAYCSSGPKIWVTSLASLAEIASALPARFADRFLPQQNRIFILSDFAIRRAKFVPTGNWTYFMECSSYCMQFEWYRIIFLAIFFTLSPTSVGGLDYWF